MQERKVPGGALAVVKDRRLVHARGYGWADREKKIEARPDTLFRLASVSKPITAVAALKLAEQGRLDLDARPFDLLELRGQVPPGKKLDERWRRITVRQLLHHTGGWDRDKSFDPMFRAEEIAKELAVSRPAGPREVIRYMLGQPLDFDPGARYAYSNFGYCVVGRVIEKITGQTYEAYVREKILAPIGIQRMRIGASLESRKAEGEARYYTPDNSTTRNVFPDGPALVRWPYGSFHLEAMDAHGGWIASAVDLARFAAALDDAADPPLLKPETLRTMAEPPAALAARNSPGRLDETWYGCGWQVRPLGKAGQPARFNLWHFGSMPGTATMLVRRADGLSLVALFNQRSEDPKKPDGAIDGELSRAAAGVKEWPAVDLFAL